MPKAHSPRHGSMQFWPRKRAAKEIPRVRYRLLKSDSKVDGFYGYKVGMTQVTLKDSYSNSLTKNQIINKAVTLIECPPLKVAGIRFYKSSSSGFCACSDVFGDKLDKELSKKMIVPKAQQKFPDDFDDIRLIVYTQPKLTGIGKKKPEVFELALNGSKEDKLAYAKEKLGKEIDVSEALKPNELVDIHGVTTGRGYQGPVKRFGIQIKVHKTEKNRRMPGSLGPWCGQQHIMYRVPHPGQKGYHLRTEYNKAILSISKDPKQVNPKGGFVRYGNIKNDYVMIMGSVLGPSKRMVRLVHPIRPNTKKKTDKLQLIKVSLESRQR